MALTAVIRDALRSSTDIQPLVAQRVYRDERPAGDPLPAIVLLLISDPRPRTYSGQQSLRSARVQIDCLADSRGLADAIGEALIAAVDGHALADRPSIESARIINVRNDSSRLVAATSTTFRTAIDLMVWHHPEH